LKIFLLVLLGIVVLTTYIFAAPIGRHRASNTDAVETEIFVPPPDSIAYIKGGIAIEVSDEKRDQIYNVFAGMAAAKPKFNYYWTTIGKHRLIKYVTVNTSIEFRYEQRLKTERGREYDAILLSFDGEGRLVPVYSKNGIYNTDATYGHFRFTDEYYAELKQAVNKAFWGA
jgi:hypothetical protein